jgi:VanZ family protein
MVKKNILSLLVACVILFLSFTGASTFNKLHLPAIPYLDKIVHSIMYFSLMSALLFENRKELNSLKSYFSLALIPLLFGGTIEIMQSMFTSSRSGDILDFCANAAGILLASGSWMLVKRLFVKNTR